MTRSPETQPDAPAPRVSYGELLRRNRDFRLLFIARSVSLLGDWFNTLAVFDLLDQLRGREATAFASVLILKLLPLLVLGAAAGVVADRYSRKRVMIWTDLLRAAVVCGFLVLAVWPSMPLLIGLTFLQTSLSAFFEPARTAAVAQVCRGRELVTANALLAVTWSIMLTLGAGLGGLASHAFGWETAIVLDALTYLVSALVILPARVPRHAVPPRPRGLRPWLGIDEALDGLRFMLRNPPVATLVSAKAAWGLAGGLSLLLTMMGQRLYPVAGSPVLGMTVFYAARGLGTALGPILARRLAHDRPRAMHTAIFVSFLVAAGAYALVGLVQHLAVAVIFVIVAHLGGATIWVFSTVLLQRFVPVGFQGRVFAAEMALFTLDFTLSTALYAHLLDNRGIDLHVLVIALAASILLGGVVWGRAARRWPLVVPVAPPPPRAGDITPPVEAWHEA